MQRRLPHCVDTIGLYRKLKEPVLMNIKTFFRSALALGAAAATVTGYAASDTATATATVIVPITITKAVDLSFGKFAHGAGGTVTVSNSGARTATGAILSAVGSTPTAARFNIVGDALATYSIAIAPDAAISNGGAGVTNNMALAISSDFAGANVTTGDVTTGGGTLSAGGLQSIFIGGTLTVNAAQVAGAYTGNIVVTVEYN
jgi:hypothetical protein